MEKKVNDKEQKAYKKNNFVVLSSDYNKMIKNKILRLMKNNDVNGNMPNRELHKY